MEKKRNAFSGGVSACTGQARLFHPPIVESKLFIRWLMRKLLAYVTHMECYTHVRSVSKLKKWWLINAAA